MNSSCEIKCEFIFMNNIVKSWLIHINEFTHEFMAEISNLKSLNLLF